MSSRFCTSCQSTQPLEGGYTKATRAAPRWICANCRHHKSESIYKAKEPASPEKLAKLMAQVYGRAEWR